MNKKNIILIGLGPHAQRIYYRFLSKYKEQYNINLRLLVELEDKKAVVEEFLGDKAIKPQEILYLKNDSSSRLGKRIPTEVKETLDNLVKKEKIHGVIISTEPKAHMIYAMWALDTGINILMDKPITSPVNVATNQASAKQIYGDYLELIRKSKKSKSKFYIVCQRRNHDGYTLIKDYLSNFVKKYDVPISYIDIYHSDGTWNFPHEYEKENHPYKYGYGKLMHSGYHSVDLFSWLTEINMSLERLKFDKVKLYTAKFTPNDFFVQKDSNFYKKFFGQQGASNFIDKHDPKSYKNYGELDAFTLGQIFHKDKVVSTFSIDLQQNSFSRRGWYELPKDTYKSNGRLRHERINIQVGHLLNIQVHSSQSYQAGKRDNDSIGFGNEDHFDIYFFRNKEIVGGKSFEKIELGEEMRKRNTKDKDYLGHNEKGRESILLSFINGKDNESMLEKHNLTNYFLSHIYQSMAKGHKTGNSQHEFKLTDMKYE